MNRDVPLPTDSTDLPVRPGDRVRLGRGYQEWTVRAVLDGDELLIEADAGRQSIAGSPFQQPQTRRVAAARVTLLHGGER